MRVKPGKLTEMETRFVAHAAVIGDPASAARAAGSRASPRDARDAAMKMLARPRVWNALQQRIAERMAQMTGPALGLLEHAIAASQPRGNRKATVSAAVGLKAAEIVFRTVSAEAKEEGAERPDGPPDSEADIDAQLERLQRHKAVLDAVDVDPFDEEGDPFDDVD